MAQISFSIVLNKKEFKIPTKFNSLGDVSSNIYDELIFSQDHNYFVKSNVSEEVMKSFINYWITGEVPEICVDNFAEYSKLSDEFNILKKEILEKKNEFGNSLDLYQNLKNLDEAKRLKYEKDTSSNLDNFLEKYGIEMMKLPIDTLYRIFNQPERKLTNHDLAYSLIIEQYRLSSNPKIFILLSSLDGSKLSRQNLSDSLFNAENRYGFSPKTSDSDILAVAKSEKTVEEQITKLQKVSEEQKDQIIKISSELKTLEEKKNEKMKNFQTTIKINTNEIESLKTKQSASLSELESTQSKELFTMKKMISTQQEEIEKIDKKDKENIEKVNKLLSDQTDQLNSAKQNETSRFEFHKKDHQKRNPGRSVDISYNSENGDRLNGIIRYLSDECGGGNVHHEGCVEVTSSSILPKMPVRIDRPIKPDYNYTPINIVDLDNELSCFESDIKPNSWVCYDFVDAKVRPNAYSIRAYINGNNFLQNWRIEGSNDKVNWTMLDERRSEKSICRTGATNTFFIDGDKVREYYRYLRLTQNGQSSANIDCLSFSALEYYGSIIE